ncbi:MAG: hypothetical protein AYL30_002120 [Candidatus Hecatellales archaeon B24]|nr:MAG: hypothetical protein AYL30_002120 [Candidatus Hecatellales archaeon B24]
MKPLNLKRFEEELKRKGVRYRLIKLRTRTVSSRDVARHAEGEVKEDEVCKTVILKGDRGNLYAVLTLGYRKVNLNLVGRLVGQKVRLASLEELEDEGLKPGAVCPLTVNAQLIVDEEVFSKEKVNFSSGSEYHGVEIKPQDLYKLVDFVRARVSIPLEAER